jgi:hypothetical protein
MLHEFLPCEEQRAASRRRRLLRFATLDSQIGTRVPREHAVTFGMPSLMRVLLSIPNRAGTIVRWRCGKR